MLDKDIEDWAPKGVSSKHDDPVIIKNTKFSTAALAFSLRMPLTGHNLAYASLLARMQMNASEKYPSVSVQQVALSDLYDLDFAVVPQLYGNKLILTYVANFIEPSEILDPDYTYEQVIKTVADIIQHPLLDQSILELSKSQLADSYRELMESPANRALDGFFRLWYKDTPDYAYTFMGPIDEIQNADLDSVKKYFDVLHHAPAIIYGIARDYKFVNKLAAKTFTYTGLLEDFWSIGNTLLAPRDVVERTEDEDNLQAQLFMGYGHQSRLMSFNEQVTGIVLAQYLAGDQSSKLFTKIREELGAAYAVDANCYPNNSLFLINTGLDPEKVGQAKEIIMQEVAEIAAGNVDKELFTKSKKAVRRNRLIREDQESFYLVNLLKHEFFIPYDGMDFLKTLSQVSVQSLIRFVKKLSFKESYVLK